MKKTLFRIAVLLVAVLCTGCASAPAQAAPEPAAKAEDRAGTPVPAQGPEAPETEARSPARNDEEEETNVEKRLRLSINDTAVAVDWEDNESVEALTQLVSPEPLTVQMSMYGGFEQVGPLGTDLPRNDRQTTTQAGDIVLYSGDQIVLFYGSNSWAYTRLGRVADMSASELGELLGGGDVTVTLSWE